VANNLMTIGAMMALQEMGISIPGDVAYVGFDDFDWAGFLRPQLTMIAQPTYEIGRTAAQLVIERIGQEGDKPARRIALGGRLMVRESSGALSTGDGGPRGGGDGTAALSDGVPMASLPNDASADATAPAARRRTGRAKAASRPEAKT
jgi:hypothetical protein